MYFDKGYLYAEYMATLLHLGLRFAKVLEVSEAATKMLGQKLPPEDIPLFLKSYLFPGNKKHEFMESHCEC